MHKDKEIFQKYKKQFEAKSHDELVKLHREFCDKHYQPILTRKHSETIDS